MRTYVLSAGEYEDRHDVYAGTSEAEALAAVERVDSFDSDSIHLQVWEAGQIIETRDLSVPRAPSKPFGDDPGYLSGSGLPSETDGPTYSRKTSSAGYGAAPVETEEERATRVGRVYDHLIRSGVIAYELGDGGGPPAQPSAPIEADQFDIFLNASMRIPPRLSRPPTGPWDVGDVLQAIDRPGWAVGSPREPRLLYVLWEAGRLVDACGGGRTDLVEEVGVRDRTIVAGDRVRRDWIEIGSVVTRIERTEPERERARLHPLRSVEIVPLGIPATTTQARNYGAAVVEEIQRRTDARLEGLDLKGSPILAPPTCFVCGVELLWPNESVYCVAHKSTVEPHKVEYGPHKVDDDPEAG